MPKRLLIVEESLRDLKAHWFEYIKTIGTAAGAMRYEVDVACNSKAELPQVAGLKFIPLFKYAYYLDQGKKKLPGEKYYGFILHSLRLLRVLWPFMGQKPKYETIFAPTVVVHHLIAWWLILKFHPKCPKKAVLFFVTNPGVWDSVKGKAFVPRNINTRIMAFLLKSFKKMEKSGLVVFGCETRGAKEEFETLSGLPFTLMPHPVAVEFMQGLSVARENGLIFGSYGFARHEKGSDILKEALCLYYKGRGDKAVRFRLQWLAPFMVGDLKCDISADLDPKGRVEIIDRPLKSLEYYDLLAETSCMVLPYRNRSYYARVSRVAIEAVCMGIPLIYTAGGWLEELVREFGAGIGVKDEDADGLAQAIDLLSAEYPEYRKQAAQMVHKAREYFSGRNFCKLLLGG